MTAGGDGGTELSRALRGARSAAGLRQLDVVARAGISQARLSRIEAGAALPTAEETSALANLYGVEKSAAEHLAHLAQEARAGIRDTRLVVQRGSTLAMQQRWRAIEGRARTVRAYQPAIVLGVLQTPEYAAVASRTPVDSDVVRDRMLRHERLLAEPGRRHLLIQTEGALRQAVGSSDVMAAQLDRLQQAAAAPNVDLAVIPAAHPVDLVVAVGFHIYDDTAVVVGIEVAAATLTDPADVAHFRDIWERLWAAAVHGDDALALVRASQADAAAPSSR